MTEFERRVVEHVRVDAEARARGKFGWLRRAHERPRELYTMTPGPRGGRFSRAAIMSAVSEAAERFSEQERFEFDHDRTLPNWFWTWVDERAKWWDSEV
ncbi:MAG TPA: hypothetical protein VNQ77_07270 [Frankiaceae bacterium]|nr:hypothetical protein [Frankiaceae bacterium]